jgi:hypothetical protein
MGLIRVTRGVPKFNIQIGPMKDAVGQNPSAVLSVADSFELSVAQFPMFQWVPILETGRSWGYRPFYSAKRILDFYCLELKVPLVFVGCHGGIHRSPLTVFCWLLSLGMTPEQAEVEFYGNFKAGDPLTMYKKDIEKGYCPPDLPMMYKLMREQPTWSYQGILQGICREERITYLDTSEVVKIRV